VSLVKVQNRGSRLLSGPQLSVHKVPAVDQLELIEWPTRLLAKCNPLNWTTEYINEWPHTTPTTMTTTIAAPASNEIKWK